MWPGRRAERTWPQRYLRAYAALRQKQLELVDRRLGACKVAISAPLLLVAAWGAVLGGDGSAGADAAGGDAGADAGGPLACAVAWLVYVTTLSLHQLVLRRWPAFYSAHRTSVLLALKAALAAELSALVVVATLEPPQHLGTWCQTAVMGTGLVLLNCTGVLMPVALRHHVAASVATVAAFDALLLPAVVDTLLCTPASAELTARAHAALDAAAAHVGSFVLPMPSEAPAPAGQREAATALVLWLQLCFGLLLPSAYLHCFEQRARSSFLWQQLRAPPGHAVVAAAAAAAASLARPAPPAALGRQASAPAVPGGSAPGLGSADLVAPAAAASGTLEWPLLVLLAAIVASVVWQLLQLASPQLTALAQALPSAAWGSAAARRYGAGSCIASPPLQLVL